MKFKRAFLMEAGKFELREVEEIPQGDEVLVKIASCGLCSWELNFWKGRLNFTGYPHPLGHEYAGAVVELGPVARIHTKKENAEERLASITRGRFADFVIEGTGVPALLNEAQRYVKPGGRGRLVLMSSHEAAAKEFDFREATNRGLSILAAHPNFSPSQEDDFRRAVELVNNGTFQVRDLVSHEFRLAEIQKAFETLASKPAGFLKGIVIP